MGTGAGRAAGGAGSGLDWADAFSLLIAHGHRHGDILEYTLGQFDAYARLAARRDRQALRMQLLAPWLALQGRDPLRRALAALDDDPPGPAPHTSRRTP